MVMGHVYGYMDISVYSCVYCIVYTKISPSDFSVINKGLKIMTVFGKTFFVNRD
jgi:predicted signal transduction protein with EAL and GGDEF domain